MIKLKEKIKAWLGIEDEAKNNEFIRESSQCIIENMKLQTKLRDEIEDIRNLYKTLLLIKLKGIKKPFNFGPSDYDPLAHWTGIKILEISPKRKIVKIQRGNKIDWIDYDNLPLGMLENAVGLYD